MTTFDYTLDDNPRPSLGLIVLQSDLTVEEDFNRVLGARARLMVSRVPSGVEVSQESLADMADHLTAAARLFPHGHAFKAVGYACTSGTAQIGPGRIARLVRDGVQTGEVTEPVSALVSACRALGLRRLAFLSPYVAEVSDRLRRVLEERGVSTPVFGTFAEPTEALVARISEGSVRRAALSLCAGGDVDGLFLSCTNLRTFDVIPGLEKTLGIPVLSSNLVLAWDLLRLVGAGPTAPSSLLAAPSGAAALEA